MKNAKFQLSSKRDNLRVQIRKQNISEAMKDRRRKLLSNDSSEQAILTGIDCIAAINNVRHSYDPLAVSKSIEQILFYARSSRAQHIYALFNQELVEHLVGLLHKSIKERKQKSMEKVTKHLLWILTNYSPMGQCTISHDFVQLLLGLSRSQDSVLNDLILISLGNLCQNRCYKDLILQSGMLNEVAENRKRFPNNSLSYFLMKILQDLDYDFLSVTLDKIVKVLMCILYESDIYDTAMNAIQALTALFTVDNIRKNIRLILSNSKQIKAIFEWVIKDLPESIANSRAIAKTVELINIFFLVQCNREEDQDQLIEFLYKNTLDLTFQIILKFKDSKSNNLRASIYELIQNVCANADFGSEIFLSHRWLLDNLLISAHSDIYKIKVLCIGAICNLCRCCQQNEVVEMISKRVISFFVSKLYQYEDNQLNMSIMKSLQEIFWIGQCDKQERELMFNQYFLEFKNAGGFPKLVKIYESQNKQLSQKANELLQKYRNQYDNTNHENSL